MTNPPTEPPRKFSMSRRLNGVHLAPGSIVGPNGMGEFMVAVDVDKEGTTFRYATINDIADAQRRIRLTGEVHTVAEYKVIRRLAGGKS